MSSGADLDLTSVDAVPDLWAEVVGQDDAVAQLQAAVRDPVHAYLLVGPPGSGRREAARAFAADLLADGLDDESAARVRQLCAREHHPAMAVVERVGPYITIEQARWVREQASLSPAEGGRQVFVLVDVHLLAQPGAGALLKTVEEPAPGTFLVLVGEELPPELATIASRCVRVPFAPVPEAVLRRRLESEGVDATRAELAAAVAGGDLRRARLLTTDEELAARHRLWRSVPERLDGTGATVAAVADELLGAIEGVLEPLKAVHQQELEDLTEQLEAYGRVTKASLKELADRQTRESRRIRTEELRSGVRALAARYRDELAGGLDPDEYVVVGAAVQRWSEDLTFNPNERLALWALLVGLPPLRSRV